MKTKIILGATLVAVLAGGIFLVSRSNSSPSTKYANELKNVEEVADDAQAKVTKEVPDNLEQCPEDIFSNMSSCTELPDNTVCGYDHTTYEDGREENHGLEYRTPCHYCNFFGKDGVKDMMGTTVESLGYTDGPCK